MLKPTVFLLPSKGLWRYTYFIDDYLELPLDYSFIIYFYRDAPGSSRGIMQYQASVLWLENISVTNTLFSSIVNSSH